MAVVKKIKISLNCGYSLKKKKLGIDANNRHLSCLKSTHIVFKKTKSVNATANFTESFNQQLLMEWIGKLLFSLAICVAEAKF